MGGRLRSERRERFERLALGYRDFFEGERERRVRGQLEFADLESELREERERREREEREQWDDFWDEGDEGLVEYETGDEENESIFDRAPHGWEAGLWSDDEPPDEYD